MRFIMMGAFALLSGATLAATPAGWTVEQDRADMMRQLGITALIPGPSGDEHAPNHANIDEAKANPYPVLPDPLRLRDGRIVRDAGTWWSKRRPEILEDYTREV